MGEEKPTPSESCPRTTKKTSEKSWGGLGGEVVVSEKKKGAATHRSQNCQKKVGTQFGGSWEKGGGGAAWRGRKARSKREPYTTKEEEKARTRSQKGKR